MCIIEKAAQAAHEANRVYCMACGDDSLLPWDESPDWQRASVISEVERIAKDPATTPEQSHAGWLETKKADGWVYGKVKDVGKKEHPCMLPYVDLPTTQKVKDTIFGAVVRGVLSHSGLI